MEGIPDRECRIVFTDDVEETVSVQRFPNRPTCDGGDSIRCTTGVSEVRLASGR